MKILSVNPMIITKYPESNIGIFEKMGFQQTQSKPKDEDAEYFAHRMSDENGFYVDVVQVPVTPPQTYTAIRIIVDDYEEAYQAFVSMGFQRLSGFAPSSEYTFLISPTGFIIDLCEYSET